MAKKKPDIEIGHRAYEEAIRLFCKPRFANQHGITRQILHSWSEGISPSALYLTKMHYAGADVLYILTGKRTGMGR
jgi:hypothetical protein